MCPWFPYPWAFDYLSVFPFSSEQWEKDKREFVKLLLSHSRMQLWLGLLSSCPKERPESSVGSVVDYLLTYLALVCSSGSRALTGRSWSCSCGFALWSEPQPHAGARATCQQCSLEQALGRLGLSWATPTAGQTYLPSKSSSGDSACGKGWCAEIWRHYLCSRQEACPTDTVLSWPLHSWCSSRV